MIWAMRFPAFILAISAVACAPVAEPGQPGQPPAMGGGTCDASGAQSFVGQAATKDTGDRIVAATGARTFQWVGPDMAVTMDYRPDRVRVAYDKDMRIVSVICG